ncbi:MAG: cytochrome B [Candidatus Ryanbacteria bacterium CG10_big_fil_rev_8_21_14_0_10_43_42]|uniref:Cytochrome B n=1 Tax=Candidatus Ryanbacteria bacterium CG10_big_fil_rev_8_21_14_0_10_43_42 TaxID=1974864 RepID=A0A2M8KXX6_9BACT|nr:MAG: cytochrome B [Candidatus Ryanbacteria bacterium CG10_big_fil_rev_8_21_14_0_10_43_42]
MSRLRWIHTLYHWTLSWAGHSYAAWALFGIAFIESSFFLIPPDVLLIPMVLARPTEWLRYAVITTIGSVLGGIAGYYIGLGLWESIGVAIVEFYHLGDVMHAIELQYQMHAFFTIFTAGFTPIPYKVITIASGLFHVPIITLISASFIGRGLRFLLVAGLIGIWGERMKVAIERHFDILSIMFVMLLVGGFFVITWVF